MAERPRVWFITGVSSGFGRELALAALERGDVVAGTLRKPEQLAEFKALAPGRARAYQLDVTDAKSIPGVANQAIRDTGGVDVLVNNAGYGLVGAAEEVGDAEARRQIETNFFGTLNVTRAFLPQFRERKRGRIVNFSSLAGVIGIPGMSIYCASKFAVEGLSEALASELAPLGIRVLIVEPGGFRTSFAAGSIAVSANVIDDYKATPAGQTRAMIAKYAGHEPGDPRKAARALIQVVDSAAPPLRIALGADALATVRGKIEALGKEATAWEALSRSTDLDLERNLGHVQS